MLIDKVAKGNAELVADLRRPARTEGVDYAIYATGSPVEKAISVDPVVIVPEDAPRANIGESRYNGKLPIDARLRRRKARA
jgi:hypothetical protein